MNLKNDREGNSSEYQVIQTYMLTSKTEAVQVKEVESVKFLKY